MQSTALRRGQFPALRRIAVLSGGLLVATLAVLPAGRAATLVATVLDEAGRPLPDAVITIRPTQAAVAYSLPAAGPVMIDQQSEAFVPGVVVIQVGGSVVFRNSDAMRHHVYSFAPIRPFELVQAAGEVSRPVRFGAPGIAAIGCNIHDHMVAYVHVTDAPWAQVSDPDGRAVMINLPPGEVTVTVWHPRLRPKAPSPSQQIVISTTNQALSVTIPVLPPRRPHGRDY